MLGRNLYSIFSKQGHSCHGITRDFLDLTACSMTDLKVYDNNEFDMIIHCALSSNSIEQVIIDHNVINWWSKIHQQSRLVTFGTDAAYNPDLAHVESFYLEESVYPQWKYYAETKRMLYRTLEQNFANNWQHLVITSLFGVDFSKDDNHLIANLIKRINWIQLKRAGFPAGDNILQCGNERYIREVVYVPDLAENILALHKQKFEGLINCGSSKKLGSIYVLLKILCEVTQFPFENVKFDLNDQGPPNKFLDNTKIIKLLGIDYSDSPYKPSLSKVWDWYRT
jgi:nucleoside-diphosphate-sugar epimerase